MKKRLIAVACAMVVACHAQAAPPSIDIIHFDVQTGDATLIISPEGRGILIDAGDRGRGTSPIVEFLNRARSDGRLTSLDYTIVTHYDADHIGGMDEVYSAGWYPAIAALDRGDSNLPPYDKQYARESCSKIDADEVEGIADWGTAPANACRSRASCQILEYFDTAQEGGRRREMKAGDVLELDHGLKLTAVVANARDMQGRTAEPYFSGRRDDCAANDLSIGLLLEFGNFQYLTAGDLTGDPVQKVADVEELLKDITPNVDVYHINHHGAETSSSLDFMRAITPTVAIASNGDKHGHPRTTVIQDRIRAISPAPAVFITNYNRDEEAWNTDRDAIADQDFDGVDGLIQVRVWQQSYRVFLWRNGSAINPGTKFEIKSR